MGDIDAVEGGGEAEAQQKQGTTAPNAAVGVPIVGSERERDRQEREGQAFVAYPLPLHQTEKREDADEQRQQEQAPYQERRQPDIPGNLPAGGRAFIVVLDGLQVV